MPTILYISYDGLLEPLGQSQVFQYLLKLTGRNKIILLTYEKPADLSKKEFYQKVRFQVQKVGIRWIALTYHKSPSTIATAFDIFQGILWSVILIIRHRVQIIHARSYVSAVIAIVCKRLLRTRFIFDMRGFWADERVDGGIWRRETRVYRIAKWFERKFLLKADVTVSLTKAGIDAIRYFSYFKQIKCRFVVIPTCTNLDLFRPISAEIKKSTNVSRPFVLGYVGSAGTWYLFEQVAVFFMILLKKQSDAHLMVINRSEQRFIRKTLLNKGVSSSSFSIESAEHSDIPNIMAKMDAGVFFIKPVFSKSASAPTKLGEFLGCGLPCVTNSGVGDVNLILHDEIGIALENFSEKSMEQAVDRILQLSRLPETRQRCLQAAYLHFSLTNAVEKYQEIYDSLSNTKNTKKCAE